MEGVSIGGAASDKAGGEGGGGPTTAVRGGPAAAPVRARKFRRLATVTAESFSQGTREQNLLIASISGRQHPHGPVPLPAALGLAGNKRVREAGDAGDGGEPQKPRPMLASATRGAGSIGDIPFMELELLPADPPVGGAGERSAEGEGDGGEEEEEDVYDVYLVDEDGAADDDGDWAGRDGGAAVQMIIVGGSDEDWRVEWMAEEDSEAAWGEEDSNAEDHWANEYPDESDHDGYSSGPGDEWGAGGGGRARGAGGAGGGGAPAGGGGGGDSDPGGDYGRGGGGATRAGAPPWADVVAGRRPGVCLRT